MEKKPWHRQDGETEKAFAAFCVYLEMGKGRSISKTYRAISGRGSAKMAPGYYGTWSGKHEWKKRCNAYDSWCAEVGDRATSKAIAEHRKEIIGQRMAVNRRAYEASLNLIKKANAMLEMPITQQRRNRVIEKTEDGKPVVIKETIIIEPVRFKVSDAAQMIKIADNLARLSTDMSTENVTFDVNSELKRVAEETGVPYEVIAAEFQKMTGKDPNKVSGESSHRLEN